MARPTKSVDSLSIEITANAQNASQALNTLIKDIGSLSQAISGMDMSGITAQMQNFGKALKSINASPTARDMNKLVTAMNRYNSSVNNTNRANSGSQNGFYRLATSSYRVSTMLQRVNDKLNGFVSRIRSANKETKNFAQTVGLLYARFFLLIRGVKLLTKQVKSSMDYIEVMNYFDSSMGQVAERGVEKFKEYGYESAKAYYDSFSERAKEVTKQMSGFYPEKNGNLTPSKSSSLGMNPQQLMQFQAQYAQMASSMGVVSERSLKLSEVMTKLGADLASVKNMNFEDTWRDLTSAMVGMSRTVDKYGANIRNANMQQKLMELGINANVSALSQADKALLRTIIILDATKYGWTDLASTLDTPANQFRMLANNVKLLGQLIGNILLPVVAKILPYLNAFVIALQRLFTWLAKVLGIDLSRLMAKDKTPDNSALSDMLDEAEGLGDALDNDAKNAKKLKKQLQGFDALNNLTSKDDSTTGALDGLGNLSGLLDNAFDDAVKDYLDAWDEAFKKLTNDAEKIADKISNFFIHLFDPIRRAWKNVGEDFKESWKNAFKEVGKLVKSFMVSFWRVWGETKTQKMFEHLIGIFTDIGDIVGNLAKKFREAWDENENGYHILRAIRDIAYTIIEGFHAMSGSVKSWTEDINFAPLLSKFGEFLNAVNEVVGHLMDVMRDFLDTVILPLAKWTLEEGLPNLLQVFIDFKDKVDWEKLKANLHKIMEALAPFAKRMGEGFIKFINQIAEKIANFVNSDGFEKFCDKVVEFLDNVSADDATHIFWAIVNGLVALKGAIVVFSAIASVGTFFTALNAIKSFFGAKEIVSAGGLGTKLGTAFKAMGSGISSILGKIGSSIGSTLGRIGASVGTFVGEIQSTMLSLGGTGAGGLAGIWEFLNMDLGALVSSGSVATVGATIGTALIGGITSAIAGFKFGNWLGEHVFKDDAEFYKNFTWFQEGGFFDSLKYYFTEMIPEWAGNAKDSIAEWGETVTEKFNGVKEWITTNVTPIGTMLGIVDGKYDTTDVANAVTDMASALMDGQGEMKNAGSFLVQGLTDGLNDGTQSKLTTAMKTIGGIIKSVFCKDMQINSPSKVFYEYGGFIVDGLGNGISDKSSSPAEIIGKMAGNITKPFENLSTSFVNIGKNLMVGLSNGISAYQNSIMSRVSTIANSVTNSFRKVWQIHSPSRVMDDMGVYFMQGLENGIESMYSPIKNSVNKFGNDLAKAPDFNEQLGFDGATANVSSNATNTFNADNSETNSLLRQQNSLLQAILEKDMGISEGALFKSVQNSATSYYKMTGNRAFT